MTTRFHIKASCLSLLIFLLMGVCVGASAEQAENPLWAVSVLQSEVTESIRSTQAFVDYGGTVNEVDYEDAPQAEYTFLLIKLSIGKQKAGAARFEWKYLFVEDEEGNRYSRHENDTFLDLHGLPRMKSTTLTIGNNEGFICFEVPKELDPLTLLLVYEGEGSEQKMPVTAQK